YAIRLFRFVAGSADGPGVGEAAGGAGLRDPGPLESGDRPADRAPGRPPAREDTVADALRDRRAGRGDPRHEHRGSGPRRAPLFREGQGRPEQGPPAPAAIVSTAAAPPPMARPGNAGGRVVRWPRRAHFRNLVCMTETTYSIVEARARLGAIAREVSATREPAAITDHGQTVAILVSPADALELQELRALAA